jgi:tetratricopeptide (TPR) repeat protein
LLLAQDAVPLRQMGKVVAFPGQGPEKFGYKPVAKKRLGFSDKNGQLNLFTGAKVVSLHKLSVFEEALIMDEQHDDAARELYLKAIEAGDSVADAYCNLGILESQQKNTTSAIDYFTKSLKEDPRHYEAHYNLANLYAEVGNWMLAKLHYELSITIEPQFPNSYFNLALTLAMNGEKKEAVEALYHYKKLVPASEQQSADELIESLSDVK